MFKGIGFLMKYTWRFEKRFIIYQILLQILTAAVPLSDIIIPKYIIDELTGARRIEVLLGWTPDGAFACSQSAGQLAYQLFPRQFFCFAEQGVYQISDNDGRSALQK